MATANIKAVITAEDRASEVVKGFGDDTRKAMNVAAAALTATGIALTAVAKNATDFTTSFVGATKTLARETGASAEEASSLVFALGQVGISAEEASTTFGIFSKRVHAARTEGGEAGNTFNRFGVQLFDAQGKAKSFADVLLQTSDRFKAMPDGVEKTALAMELFGRSGKDMIKFLNLGSDGIRQLQADADKFGLTLSVDTIDKVSQFIASQRQLKAATDGMKIAIGELTTPVLTRLNTMLTNVVTSINQTDGPMKAFVANIAAFGGPIATFSGASIGFIANLTQIRQAAVGGGGALATLISRVSSFAGIATVAIVGQAAYTTSLVALRQKLDDASGSSRILSGVLTFMIGIIPNLVLQHNQVTAAQNAGKLAADNLKLSSQQLADAQLAATGTALAVERAQLNYNNAVAQYGPNSLEAREAEYNLAAAKETNKGATAKAEEAQRNQTAAEQAYQRQSADMSRVLEARRGEFFGLAGAIADAVSWVESLASKIRGLPPVQQQGPWAGGGGGGGGGRSFQHGGSITAGTANVVGEAGPELFVPHSNGRIVPNNQLGGGGGGGVNFIVNIGMFAGTPMERREIAKRMFKDFQDVAKQYGVPASGLLDGANGAMIR